MLLIQQETIQRIMIRKLEKYTGCICVPRNTTKHVPPYPYITFSVIHTEARKGTYSAVTEHRDGKEITILSMPARQKWSFTVQSDKEAEAGEKAFLIHDFFAEAKRQELEDHNIIVAEISAITPRDTLLTIEYEYRKGLDITFSMENIIEKEITETIGTVVMNESLQITE